MHRCKWSTSDPLLTAYHDTEWGVPVHNDKRHFEFLVLEGAQAGLSWLTILRRREGYRKAFHNYDVKKIAKMTDKDITALSKNEGIIRNKLKIKSVITNAKAFIKVQDEFGSFDKYFWKFVNNKPIIHNIKDDRSFIAKNELSDQISKDLKKRGFTFVGSTIIYAHLQATGLVNDHENKCFRKH